ncbi:unnamed protein product [Closterium sp. NIES-65]|nr:unnamed protein product [Closterium sp. NIES-65]
MAYFPSPSFPLPSPPLPPSLPPPSPLPTPPPPSSPLFPPSFPLPSPFLPPSFPPPSPLLSPPPPLFRFWLRVTWRNAVTGGVAASPLFFPLPIPPRSSPSFPLPSPFLPPSFPLLPPSFPLLPLSLLSLIPPCPHNVPETLCTPHDFSSHDPCSLDPGSPLIFLLSPRRPHSPLIAPALPSFSCFLFHFLPPYLHPLAP